MKKYKATVEIKIADQVWKQYTYVWRAKTLGNATDRAGNQGLLLAPDMEKLQEQVSQPVSCHISVEVYKAHDLVVKNLGD